MGTSEWSGDAIRSREYCWTLTHDRRVLRYVSLNEKHGCALRWQTHRVE